MPDFDTVSGGEELSLDEAAAAYAKVTSEGADTGQPEDDDTAEVETTDDELQASDEDEGEEANGEDEPEGQPDEEDGEEPETERGRYVAHNGRVKLPDGSESTIADLIAGNMKERDYRQKTMELAPQREELKVQSAAVKERMTQLEQQSQYVAEIVRTIIPDAPDPSMLETDPQGYLRQQANREAWLQHLQLLDGQRQQFEQERQAEAQRTQAERAEREWNALVEKVPAFKDKAKWGAFANDVNKFGADYGFKPEELRALAFDHRQITVLRKAILWDKLQASKPAAQKKVEGRPPVQKGGKRLSPSEGRARQSNDALSRLKQTGSERDAVAAYLALKPKG